MFKRLFIPFRYRDASVEVIKSISKFTSKIERASIDEAYIDATGIDIPCARSRHFKIYSLPTYPGARSLSRSRT